MRNGQLNLQVLVPLLDKQQRFMRRLLVVSGDGSGGALMNLRTSQLDRVPHPNSQINTVMSGNSPVTFPAHTQDT